MTEARPRSRPQPETSPELDKALAILVPKPAEALSDPVQATKNRPRAVGGPAVSFTRIDRRPPKPPPASPRAESAWFTFRTSGEVAAMLERETIRRNATDQTTPWQWTVGDVLDDLLNKALRNLHTSAKE